MAAEKCLIVLKISHFFENNFNQNKKNWVQWWTSHWKWSMSSVGCTRTLPSLKKNLILIFCFFGFKIIVKMNWFQFWLYRLHFKCQSGFGSSGYQICNLDSQFQHPHILWHKICFLTKERLHRLNTYRKTNRNKLFPNVSFDHLIIIIIMVYFVKVLLAIINLIAGIFAQNPRAHLWIIILLNH